MDLNEAIKELSKLVKMSNVKNQAHIDLTLAPASKQEVLAQALELVKKALDNNEISQKELDESLGL